MQANSQPRTQATERLVRKGALSRPAEAFSGLLLGGALAISQVLIGGVGLLFALPAYALLGLIGLLSLFSLRQSKPAPDTFCLVGLSLFFGYMIGRALLSPVPYLARVDLYSILGGLIIYLFVATIFTDARRRLLLIAFLLAVGIVHVFIGAIQFRDGKNFMLIPFLNRYDYGRRASGFYVCPNHLAGLLEVLGVFGLSIVCWSRWPRWAKMMVVYAIGLCYFGLAITGSRGGYLSVGASLLVFAIISLFLLRRARGKMFWASIAIGAALVAVTIGGAVFFLQKSDFLRSRAENTFDTENMRIDLWKAALKEWKLEPIWGTGSGTYLYYGRQFRSERVQLDPVRVHNDYLQLLAEYGLIGAAGFILFLGAHLRSGWNNLRHLAGQQGAIPSLVSSNRLALQIGALCALGAYIVHSIFDFNLHIPANVLLLAFVFGILATRELRDEKERAPSRIPLLFCRVTMPVIGVVILIAAVRFMPGEYLRRARSKGAS